MKIITIHKLTLTIVVSCLLLLASCSGGLTPKEKLLVGKWKFEYISNQSGENVKPVGENDFMEVKEDKTFYYILNEAGIESKGTWKLDNANNGLSYTYTPKEGSEDILMRTYFVTILSETQLILQENDITYSFKK